MAGKKKGAGRTSSPAADSAAATPQWVQSGAQNRRQNNAVVERADTASTAQRPEIMGVEMPVGTDPASVRKRVELLELLLERGFTIKGINKTVGLDAIIGLIPVVGDFIGAFLGAYLVWEARNLGMPKWKIARMMGNVGFDTVIGLVPFVGDVADFLFQSNTRNVRIVKKHLDKHYPETKVIEG